jgi:hypothetical protein
VTKIPRQQVLLTFALPCLLLAAIALFWLATGKDIARFFRDPLATAGLHPLIGFISNLGVLLWATSAAVSAFGALIVRRSNPGEAASFLIFSACLSMWLCFDDLFQIHESLLPTYLGVKEAYTYVVLAIATLIYFVRYSRLILGTMYPMLMIALAFLGTSVAIDDFFEPLLRALGQGRIFLEDGAKWLGIAAWCSYQVGTAFRLVVAGTHPAEN